jgi:hypothetical protein
MITELIQGTTNANEAHEWIRVEQNQEQKIEKYKEKIENTKYTIDFYLNEYQKAIQNGYERSPLKDSMMILYRIKDTLGESL